MHDLGSRNVCNNARLAPGWVIAVRGLVPVCGMFMHGFVPMWDMAMRGLGPVCINIMHGLWI